MKEQQEFDQNTNWNEILLLMKNKNFSVKYTDYKIKEKEKGYFIQKIKKDADKKIKNKKEEIKGVNDKKDENKKLKNNKEEEQEVKDKKDEDKANEKEKGQDKKNEDKKHTEFYLFESQRQINIYLGNKLFEKLKFYSSLEIEQFIDNKGLNINELYVKGEANLSYLDIRHVFGKYIDDCELEIRTKKNIEDLKYKKVLSDTEDYSPDEYSDYFYEYFIYEDREKKKEKINYKTNIYRKIIEKNIKYLGINKGIKTFKFTGPHSIGKSFTLLRISRIYDDIAYINLKVLNKYKDDLFKSYSLIIKELERFNIPESFDKLNQLILMNYKNNNSYLNLLLEIMDFLEEIEQISIFIFDQFKNKYINPKFMEKIKTFNYIRIVQCSSINDEFIRNECIKTWSEVGKNINELTVENQDYYLYFKVLYPFFSKEEISEKNDILRRFAYLPKYKKKYEKKALNNNQFLEDTRADIEKKLDEFCSSSQIENKSILLTTLKNIIGKKIEYDKFDNIIPFCPLKFFIIDFEYSYFKVMPAFPFMINVVNYQLNEEECKNYFKTEIYKKRTIVNDYVKGDYFEASAKIGLRKYFKLPKKKNYDTVTLNEIVSMDKIVNKNDIIDDYKYEYKYDILEKQNEKNKNQIANLNDNIDKINLDEEAIEIESNDKNEQTNNTIKIEEKNSEEEDRKSEVTNNDNIEEIYKDSDEDDDDDETEEEEEDDDDDDDDDDEIEDNMENNQYNNINQNRSNIKDEVDDVPNDDLKRMLKRFKIEEKGNKNQIDYDGLSNEAIIISKNIEDYRQDEINEQKKKEQKIGISNYNGDISLFLDQFSKWGKTLDFAYMYGPKNTKTFIGFQMKCYFIKSILSNDAVDKTKIRKNCQKILVNSMKLFNCKITKWEYYLIFYYNASDMYSNINKINIQKCKDNNVCYLFYDPINQIFYSGKNNKKPITILKGDKIANLDLCVTNMNYMFDDIQKQGKIIIGKKIEKMKKYFLDDISNILAENQKGHISKILNVIKTILDINDHVFFYGKFKFSKYFIIPPDRKHIFLYKRKDKNEYIAVLKKRGKIVFTTIPTGIKLKYLYNELDVNCNYYYCLQRYRFGTKKKLTKKEINTKEGKLLNISNNI